MTGQFFPRKLLGKHSGFLPLSHAATLDDPNVIAGNQWLQYRAESRCGN